MLQVSDTSLIWTICFLSETQDKWFIYSSVGSSVKLFSSWCSPAIFSKWRKWAFFFESRKQPSFKDTIIIFVISARRSVLRSFDNDCNKLMWLASSFRDESSDAEASICLSFLDCIAVILKYSIANWTFQPAVLKLHWDGSPLLALSKRWLSKMPIQRETRSSTHLPWTQEVTKWYSYKWDSITHVSHVFTVCNILLWLASIHIAGSRNVSNSEGFCLFLAEHTPRQVKMKGFRTRLLGSSVYLWTC